MVTAGGVQTPESYDKTIDHIERVGSIDAKWIEPKLRQYCVRQGVYLACRDTGNLDVFKEACKEEKIYIPNF